MCSGLETDMKSKNKLWAICPESPKMSHEKEMTLFNPATNLQTVGKMLLCHEYPETRRKLKLTKTISTKPYLTWQLI